MARLRILQHHPAEDPGSILEWMTVRGHTPDIVHPAQTSLPHEPTHRDNATGGTTQSMFDALIVLGGPWCAFADDRPEWLRQEQAWLGERLRGGVPVFAICLGAQVVAQALGARLRRMPSAETGWVVVDWLEDDEQDDDARTRPPRHLQVLQWHEDRFELPPGCRHIVAGIDARPNPNNEAGDGEAALCPIQGYASADGRVVGLQFHAEWTPANAIALHAAFGADCPLPPADAHTQRYAPMHDWLHARLDRWLGDAGV